MASCSQGRLASTSWFHEFDSPQRHAEGQVKPEEVQGGNTLLARHSEHRAFQQTVLHSLGYTTDRAVRPSSAKSERIIDC